jgi:hypothetical protein
VIDAGSHFPLRAEIKCSTIAISIGDADAINSRVVQHASFETSSTAGAGSMRKNRNAKSRTMDWSNAPRLQGSRIARSMSPN